MSCLVVYNKRERTTSKPFFNHYFICVLCHYCIKAVQKRIFLNISSLTFLSQFRTRKKRLLHILQLPEKVKTDTTTTTV